MLTTVLVVTLVLPTILESAYYGGNVCEYVRRHPSLELLPQPQQCGLSRESNKVMGGVNARLGEFPWIAALYLQNQYNNAYFKFCDGSLINNKFVITAAHCMVLYTQNNILTVRLGEHNVNSGRDCARNNQNGRMVCAPPAVEYQVERAFYNKYFQGVDTLPYDIAIIRLQGTVQFNAFIRPICLPTSCQLMNLNMENLKVTIAGWGVLQDEPWPRKAAVLQRTDLIVIPNRWCARQYYGSLRITDSQLCAQERPGKSACHGDSGGPLTTKVGSSQYLVGVVSAGVPCDYYRPSNQANVFTKVAFYLPWILDAMQQQ